MTKSKTPRFRKGDIIIRNYKFNSVFHKYNGEGSYISPYDKLGETTYTIEYVRKQNYKTFYHWCYRLKEANQMYIHDSVIVDEEFDLYSDFIRGLKIKKILEKNNYDHKR